MRIIFAGWTRTLSDSQILNELGIVDRLLSYYELRDQTDEDLAKFVETGNWPITKKPIKADFNEPRYLARRRMYLAARLEGYVSRERMYEQKETAPDPDVPNEEYLDDRIPF